MTEKLCNMMVRGVPDDLRWKLRAIAARRHETISKILTRLITEFIEQENEGRGMKMNRDD